MSTKIYKYSRAAIALALLLGLIRAGQFDDLDSPPWRMLADDLPVADQSDRSSP